MRIDVNEGRDSEQLQAISRGIHDAILAEEGVPGQDYFHILTEHPVGQIVAQDAGLGFERTPDVVTIQIFPQAGRTQEAGRHCSPPSRPRPEGSPQRRPESSQPGLAGAAKIAGRRRLMSPSVSCCKYVSTNL